MGGVDHETKEIKVGSVEHKKIKACGLGNRP
jgi:hypothetical protein